MSLSIFHKIKTPNCEKCKQALERDKTVLSNNSYIRFLFCKNKDCINYGELVSENIDKKVNELAGIK